MRQEKKMKQVMSFQIAKKCKKWIKSQKSHQKEVFLFNRLVASDMSSMVMKEFKSNDSIKQNGLKTQDIYTMIENQIDQKSMLSPKLSLYMNKVTAYFENLDQPKINREQFIENLKQNLLRWNKNRDMIQGVKDTQENFKKRHKKELSPAKVKKIGNCTSLSHVNSKTIKPFENQNEILVTHYDESQIYDNDYYKNLFEHQVNKFNQQNQENFPSSFNEIKTLALPDPEKSYPYKQQSFEYEYDSLLQDACLTQSMFIKNIEDKINEQINFDKLISIQYLIKSPDFQKLNSQDLLIEKFKSVINSNDQILSQQNYEFECTKIENISDFQTPLFNYILQSYCNLYGNEKNLLLDAMNQNIFTKNVGLSKNNLIDIIKNLKFKMNQKFIDFNDIQKEDLRILDENSQKQYRQNFQQKKNQIQENLAKNITDLCEYNCVFMQPLRNLDENQNILMNSNYLNYTQLFEKKQLEFKQFINKHDFQNEDQNLWNIMMQKQQKNIKYESLHNNIILHSRQNNNNIQEDQFSQQVNFILNQDELESIFQNYDKKTFVSNQQSKRKRGKIYIFSSYGQVSNYAKHF